MKFLTVFAVFAFVSSSVIAQAVKKSCKREYEIYQECGSACPRRCSNLNAKAKCIDVCIPGCFCQDGYAYDPFGRCIPIRDCPRALKCKANEQWSIKCACDDVCDGCPPGVQCRPGWGCHCRDGFLRDDTGKCIPAKKCPKKCPKANQVYIECDSKCTQPTCDNPEVTFCKKRCIPGCFCKEGFVLDAKNNCIPLDRCPKRCRSPFEVYSQCGANGCQNTCENPTFSHVCKGPCIAGCICKDGYIRDSNGRCIRIDECPKECPENELITWICGCGEESCSGRMENCQCEPIEGCGCIDGYLRDSNEKCIPADECPKEGKCTKPNEEYRFCGQCDFNCDDPTGAATICLEGCFPGCYCKKGYVRDKNGNCILIEQCPKKPQCTNAHEVYSECNAHACHPTCDRLENPRPCDPLPGCHPGCICEEGYVRNSDGNCVLPDQCPRSQVCAKPFTTYTTCGSACPETCDDVTGTASLKFCTLQCVMGCFCAEGYVLDKSGNCILRKDCLKNPQCKSANEVYSECGANGCQNTCENPTLSQVCKGTCIAGCVCAEGYLRNEEGKCVRPRQCVQDPVCSKPHTTYTSCGSACPATCDSVKNIKPKICTMQCVIGCVCEAGYVLNHLKDCILVEDCPKFDIPLIKG